MAIAVVRIFHVSVNMCFLFLSILLAIKIQSSQRYHAPSLWHWHSSFPHQSPLAETTLAATGATKTGSTALVCKGLDKLRDHATKCSYLQLQQYPCVTQGYIDYLKLFYCLCGGSPALGYTALLLWLLVLFYLLGTTASRYFCSSLEGLSSVLGLSPAVAGATLLSLGNGAPDVFAAVVSFTGGAAATTGAVGIGGVLGGALFVSTVVVGVISLCVHEEEPVIECAGFVRDACFLLAAEGALGAVMLVGRIDVWGAAGFASVYVVYVILVSFTHCRQARVGQEWGLEAPLLLESIQVDPADGRAPVLVETAKPVLQDADDRGNRVGVGTGGRTDDAPCRRRCCRSPTHLLLHLLELPLHLPRRLTIPVVDEDRWSKPYAVASAFLAPLLLALLWNTHLPNQPPTQSLDIYLLAALLGLALAIAAIKTTDPSRPPKTCLLPWLAGGFAMSVLWSYIAAGELVALLVSMGRILGINPSVLAFTVLAWGNSVGDLMTNVAMAVQGGPGGAQIAVSGCYAGPLFNTLVGLGISIAFSAWKARPGPLLIPVDRSTYEVLGFLVGAVLWALLILPHRRMKLDRVLGVGLLAIYLCFLSVRLCESLLWLPTA